MIDDHNNLNEPATREAREQLFWALLASDLAQEVRAEFNGRLSVGLDVPSATAHVLSRFHPALSSPAEGPVVLIVLAVLQLREDYLQPVIRDAAVDLIDSGEALNAYRSTETNQRKATAGLLDQLVQLLRESTTIED